MALLDFLYGGPSTELNPPLDPAQFPQDVGYGPAPNYPTQTLQRMRQAQGNPLGTQLGLLSGMIPEQPATPPAPTIAGAPADVTLPPKAGAPPLPPPTEIPTPQVASVDQGPLNTPATRSADTPTPAPATRTPSPSPVANPQGASQNLLGRINDYLHRHSNMLIAMGAGMAGGRSFGEGLSRAGAGALQAQQMDIGEQQREAFVQSLMQRGYSRQDAEAIVGQPRLLPQLTKLAGPWGQEYSALFAPLTGQTQAVTTVPSEGTTKIVNGRHYVVQNGQWHEMT